MNIVNKLSRSERYVCVVAGDHSFGLFRTSLRSKHAFIHKKKLCCFRLFYVVILIVSIFKATSVRICRFYRQQDVKNVEQSIFVLSFFHIYENKIVRLIVVNAFDFKKGDFSIEEENKNYF